LNRSSFKQGLFADAWEETIDELEPGARKLFFDDQKLSIDIKMGMKEMSKGI
jgi:hypothetical protein